MLTTWKDILAAVTLQSSNLLSVLAQAVLFIRQNVSAENRKLVAEHRSELLAAFQGSVSSFNMYYSELTRLSIRDLQQVAKGKLSRRDIRKLLAPKHAHSKSATLHSLSLTFFKHITTKAQAQRVTSWLKQYSSTLK